MDALKLMVTKFCRLGMWQLLWVLNNKWCITDSHNPFKWQPHCQEGQTQFPASGLTLILWVDSNASTWLVLYSRLASLRLTPIIKYARDITYCQYCLWAQIL